MNLVVRFLAVPSWSAAPRIIAHSDLASHVFQSTVRTLARVWSARQAEASFLKVQSDVVLVSLCGYTHWDARKIQGIEVSSGIGRAVGEKMFVRGR
jgi:hypothetical protein